MRTKIIGFVVCVALAPLVRATPIAEHGRLSVHGASVVDEHGQPVSLAGVSLFWSQWQGQFWTPECIAWLAQDWKVGVVRAAMGIEHGGYLDRPDVERARVERVIDAATAAGVYVIVDWHDHHASQHTDAAVKFFSAMARRCRGNPAVLYEIYNEPMKDSWSKSIKPYAEKVVAAIRAEDPEGIIIVGTSQWSQLVEEAAQDPVAGKNLVYTLHFYAGSHKDDLRAAAERALRGGLPLFVSEWGGCNANGNGAIDRASVDAWLDLIRRWHLSLCGWAVSNKPETSSMLQPSADPKGHWTDADLTDWGRFSRQTIRDWSAAK